MNPDHPLGGIYALMDRHGMLPDDFACVSCARPLGTNPAELYAGTYNGLCYPCTSAGPYVTRSAVLDGAREVSWPPHSPSWRRDREKHIAYEGCEVCSGLGIVPGTRSWGCSGGMSCDPCWQRYSGHPVRQAADRWLTQVMRSCDAVFQRAVDQAAEFRASHQEAPGGTAQGVHRRDRDGPVPGVRGAESHLQAGLLPHPEAGLGSARRARLQRVDRDSDTEEWARNYCKHRGLDYDALKAGEDRA